MTATLSGYELGTVIGRGRTGEVWIGREQASGIAVAAKVACAELADDPRWRAQLLTARSAATNLDHVNIVPIRTIVADAGGVTIVSEMIEGTDLRRLIEAEKNVTPKRAAAIVGSVLSALAAAHLARFVHGSLTAENVLVTLRDEVRITDFGIADPGRIKDAGPADDVFAAGVVFHELLTGSAPARTVDAELTRPDGLPDKLWDLLASMLATDPQTRPSAADARLRLAALIPRLSMLEALAPALERPTRAQNQLAAVVILRKAAPRPPERVAAAPLLAEPEPDPLSRSTDESQIVPASSAATAGRIAKSPRMRPPDLTRTMARTMARLTSATSSISGWWSAFITLLGRAAVAMTSSVRVPSRRARVGSLRLSMAGIAAPLARRLRFAIVGVRTGSAWVERWVTGRVAALSRATRATRITLVAVVAIVVVAAVTAVARLVLVTPPSSFTSYAFAPASYKSVLVTNRTWTLTGHHGDQLMGNVILVNSTSGSITGAYDEVIPKSVAGADSDITFAPQPARIVQADPVVEYDYDLAPGESVSLSYSADIGPTAGSPQARLTELAADQVKAQSSYLSQSGIEAPATLAALSVRPQTLTMTVGQSVAATLSGAMSDGTVASAAVLNGVQWTSADGAVASVDDAVISAIGTGSTTLTAQAGSLRSTIAVTVVDPTSSIAATEIQTSPGVSKSAQRSSSAARSTGGGTTHQAPPASSAAGPTTTPVGPATTPTTPSDTPTSSPPSSPPASSSSPSTPSSDASPAPLGLLDPVLGLLGL